MSFVNLSARNLHAVAGELHSQYASIFHAHTTKADRDEMVKAFDQQGSLAKASKKTGFTVLQIADEVFRVKNVSPRSLFSPEEVALLKRCRAIEFKKQLKIYTQKTNTPTHHEYDEGHVSAQDLLEVSLTVTQAEWYFENYFAINGMLSKVLRGYNIPFNNGDILRSTTIDLFLQRLSRDKIPVQLINNLPKNMGLLNKILKHCFLQAQARERGRDETSVRYTGYKIVPLVEDENNPDKTRGFVEDSYPSVDDFSDELSKLLEKIKEQVDLNFSLAKRHRSTIGRIQFMLAGYTLSDIASFYGTTETNMHKWASTVLPSIRIEMEMPFPTLPLAKIDTETINELTIS